MEADLQHALTDVLLGAAILFCALRLRANPDIHRQWKLTFWLAAGSAFAGAVHHGLLKDDYGDFSWPAVGVLVVTAPSYALLASAREVFGERVARAVTIIRVVGLTAYGLAIIFAGGGLIHLIIAESLTMASILGIWIYAVRIRHPKSGGMMLAILANGIAGIAFVLPSRLLQDHTGLDATSWSHLAQIPGMLLLCRALIRKQDAHRVPIL